MEEVIEKKIYNRPAIIVNPELNKYADVVMFPKKLEEAKEMLAKYPIPAEIYLKRYSKIQQEQGIEISGILNYADARTNIFWVIDTKNKYHETNYKIRTQSEVLNKLVKSFWNEPIKVHIRPQINDKNVFEYELIEVKVD